jgi:hypothetical protein
MWTLSGGAVTTVVFLSVYELGLLYRGVGWAGLGWEVRQRVSRRS